MDSLVRKFAASVVALARRGDASGRGVLIAGMADAPSAGIVEALGGLGGDEAIVALGRSAMRHPRRQDGLPHGVRVKIPLPTGDRGIETGVRGVTNRCPITGGMDR